jgi:hypothetical protein
MVREELFSLCQQFVRSRDMDVGNADAPPRDPAPEIVRSYRLAEISESEMEALLAYVGDPDEDDCCQTAGIADDTFGIAGPAAWQDEDDDPVSTRVPR